MKILPLILAHALALALPAHAANIFDLDSATLPPGETSTVQDKAAGRWNANVPLRVESVQGRAAFVLDGTQQLISEFTLPDAMAKKPFTVEVWALNPEIGKAETVVAFAPAKGGSGTEFNFSSGQSAGAFRSGFKATTPFGSAVTANAWHHLAWTYGGGADGVLRVYVDGELNAERALKFALPAQAKIHVGASGEVDSKGPKKGFSGAIARVRVQDTALTQAELRQGADLRDAFAPQPQNGATTDMLNISLRWQRGTADAASYEVFVGTDRAAVERGERSIAKVVIVTETGPIALTLGAKYFWRVAQIDKGGRTMAPGVVWTFIADAGLASESQPRDATGNTPLSLAQLAWKPGKYAVKQRVFFGASEDEVSRATKPVAEIAAGATGCPMPAKLAPGTRYFWRVDSDNGVQPSSRGPAWSFRTQDAPQKNDVTFFTSSDTHYGRENNAAINRRVIDAMNALPGEPLPASLGGGFVRTPRGVVLNGDLLDEGFDKETAPANWAEFCRDYGLTGSDGRLCFPLYEGFGNHDGGPVKSFVRAGIRTRNPQRVGLKAISENGLHYSWDWEHVHLVQLNLFGGSGPQDVKGVNGTEHDPEGALDFLRDDLAKNVGTSGRQVIVFQHFAWVGGMADWWQLEAKERFHEVVKPYRVACLINGHSHGASFSPWHDLLTVHDGSTARGEGDTGDFMVVRVTEKELILAQRKLDGTWGIQMRRPLQGAPPSEK